MTASDADIFKKVQKWIDYADDDLRLAQVAMTLSSGCPFRLVAYHAQQCAEKYLKAFLVSRRLDFPYTHNIGVLMELCAESGDWVVSLSEVENLTDYAVAVRYPGENEAITRQEAENAVTMAVHTRNVIRKVLRVDEIAS